MRNTLQKARAFENKYLPRVEGTDILPRFHMTDRQPTRVSLIYHLAEVAGEQLEYVYTGNC